MKTIARRRGITLAAGLAALAALCGGCGYYRVTDVGTERTYYTMDWNGGKYGTMGEARFRDAASGSVVTLQNVDVQPISKEEFERAVPEMKK